MDNEESDEVNSSDESILPGRARKKDYDDRWEQKHTNQLSKVCAALDWSQLPPDKLRVDHIAKHFPKFTRFSTPFLNNKITVKLIFSDLMAEWKVKTSKLRYLGSLETALTASLGKSRSKSKKEQAKTDQLKSSSSLGSGSSSSSLPKTPAHQCLPSQHQPRLPHSERFIASEEQHLSNMYSEDVHTSSSRKRQRAEFTPFSIDDYDIRYNAPPPRAMGIDLTNQGHVWPNATDENCPVLQSPLRPRMGGSSLEKDAGCSASNIFLSAKENLAVIPPQHVYHIINNEEQKLIFVLLYVMSGHTVTHEVENDRQSLIVQIKRLSDKGGSRWFVPGHKEWNDIITEGVRTLSGSPYSFVIPLPHLVRDTYEVHSSGDQDGYLGEVLVLRYRQNRR
ncbi:hypothetical protein DFJ73DRAFT_763112 [Zopfochytrium polystomum]|nr:hypothetical protein DFJ73DRAFT_763112 [Zopfochytrium polystomum]